MAGPESSWDTPDEAEVGAAFDKIFGGGGDAGGTDEASGGPEEETGAEPAASETPAESEQDENQRAADRQGGKAQPASETEEEGFVTIRGRRYREDEVMGWRDGQLRQDQFTRSQQAIAEERRDMNRRLDVLLNQHAELLASIGRRPDGSKEDPEEEADPIAPGVQKALGNMAKEIRGLQGRLETRDREEQTERENGFIRSTFDDALGRLFTEYKIPPAERALYKNAILGMGAGAADDSGRISADTIRRETLRCFMQLNRDRDKYQRQIRNETVQGLRKHAKPPVKPVSGKPAAAPAPAPQKRRSREPWDADDATREVMERLAERTSGD